MFRRTNILALVFILLFTCGSFAATGKSVDILIPGIVNLTGGPLSGGLVYTYAAGTTTPKSIYSDRALTTALDNPAELDTNGRLVAYGSGVYKFVIQDEYGSSIFTADNVEISSLENAFDGTTDPFGTDLTQTNLTVTNLTVTDTVTDTLDVDVSATIASMSAESTKITNVATGTANGDAVNFGQLEENYWRASGTTELATDKNLVVDGAASFTGKATTDELSVTNPTVPASATASGTTGDVAWDSDYVYICVDTDTWKRAALSTW